MLDLTFVGAKHAYFMSIKERTWPGSSVYRHILVPRLFLVQCHTTFSNMTHNLLVKSWIKFWYRWTFFVQHNRILYQHNQNMLVECWIRCWHGLNSPTSPHLTSYNIVKKWPTKCEVNVEQILTLLNSPRLTSHIKHRPNMTRDVLVECWLKYWHCWTVLV